MWWEVVWAALWRRVEQKDEVWEGGQDRGWTRLEDS